MRKLIHRWKSLVPSRIIHSARIRAAMAMLRRGINAIAVPGMWTNPLFDAEWYRAANPDVAFRRVNAYRHWRRHGVKEGRNPNALFDTDWYLDHNPDVRRSGLNPLDHYLRYGADEGRDPGPGFDTERYLSQNPDLAASGMNPLLHFLRTRRSDGRSEVDVGRDTFPATPELARDGSVAASVPGPATTGGRTALVLHVGRGEPWDEIVGGVGNLGKAGLFVAIDPGAEPDLEARFRELWPTSQIRRQSGLADGVRHLLLLLSDGSLSAYDLVCKVDLAPENDPDSTAIQVAAATLVGSPDAVRDALHQLVLDPAIGLLAPECAWTTDEDIDGAILDAMVSLRLQLGVASDAVPAAAERIRYQSFWFRPPALAPLAGLQFGPPNDIGPDSARAAAWSAALLRLLPAVVRFQGFSTATLTRATDRARSGARVGRRTIKLVAFYLPQFHPIPENDRWWGPGFTEWSQVVRARPLYAGHRQPRLPADLGFYDLRLPEVRAAQAELAMQYDLNAFCYYYYWFDGRRLLERPLQEVVASGNPDFPFCICWANENWTRRWDGLDKEVLVRQSYSLESNRRFIRDVIPMLRDPRYLRYMGKPVLLVYRPSDIPDLKETLAMWRRECRSASVGEIHLAGVRFWDANDVHAWGFDAAVDFPPHQIKVRDVSDGLVDLNPDFSGLIYDYGYVVRKNLESHRQGARRLTHRGLMLAWDNTARRGTSAHLAHGASPELYREWLRGVLAQEMAHNDQPESLVFINAWNEWGEGANLEPDSQFGRGYLEATHGALVDVTRRWNRPSSEVAGELRVPSGAAG